ncbi:hypothetical protein [Caviibacterium pharyngocola]|uniref:hypothetical protein n=1 Tax=Caviibacterium pharyngocola TaxID=28159 RepID=UPI001FAF52E2|nr:hypothetical protein [Caviibacterium pharyngocola]
MELSNFPIARYQFDFQVTEPIALPEYAGSALRGAFGRALRKISCMTKQDDCKSCPLYRSCPYTNIFETPAPENHEIQQFSQVPNGYMIEPQGWGERTYQIGEIFSFNLVLFGRLTQQLPLIAFAFKRAFEWNIAGGKGELIAIFLCNQHNQQTPILQKGNIIEHSQAVVLPENFANTLNIDLLTPLRLHKITANL